MSVNSTIKIFISHNSEDELLASNLVKLLRAALGISASEIRCTSVPGFGLDPGADSDEEIRIEVNNSEVLIGLLTPNSLRSSYVLFELGARWGVDKFLVPILSNGADFSDLPSPIRSKNAIKINQEEYLHDLLEKISQKIDQPLERTSAYKAEIDALIGSAKKKSEEKDIPEVEDNSATEELDDLIKTKAEKNLRESTRENKLRSKEGVSAAVDEGRVFSEKLKNLVEKYSDPKAKIYFGIEQNFLSQHKWEIKIHCNGSSAYVELHIPFSNSTYGIEREGISDAYIRTFYGNYNLFDYNRIEEKDKINSENFFYFTMDGIDTYGWSTQERSSEIEFSSEELASHVLKDFFEFATEHESDIF